MPRQTNNSTTISPKEFGQVVADVKNIEKVMNAHNETHNIRFNKIDNKLEKIDEKLDSLVTHKQLDEILKPITERQTQHASRIFSLEQRNTLADASIWRKIGLAFEGNFIKFIGLLLFMFALIVGYMFIRQDLVQRNVPIEIIDNIKSKE